MKQQIHINDQGELLLIDSPEMPERVILHDHHFEFTTSYRKKWIAYESALTSAIEKGIKFRDQEVVAKILGIPSMQFSGKSYFDLPNSYTAEVVEEEIPCPDGIEGCEVYHTRKVAVLIPLKQEVIVQTPFCVTAVCAKCGGTGIIKGGPTDIRQDEKCSCKNYVTGEPGNEAKKEAMKKLPTLHEHNQKRYDYYDQPVNNNAGVGCEICGKEMQYVDQNLVTLGNPPSTKVTCECGNSGYKVL